MLFALPTAMMTAEAATAFPVTGGQVVWVSMACGQHIGGHNGYWVWLTNLLDAAVYPQMLAKYLASMLHMLHSGNVSDSALQTFETCVCLVVVAAFCAVNLVGLDCVAATQSVAFALSLMPCVLFASLGLPDIQLGHLMASDGMIDLPLLLSWTIWLYSGFSSLGAMAGEVERPQRTYPLVVMLLLPLVVALNIVPFAVAISLDGDHSHFKAGYFATLARRLAGPWLQLLFVAGANISLLGLYHSQVLAAERALDALASQSFRGVLPSFAAAALATSQDAHDEPVRTRAEETASNDALHAEAARAPSDPPTRVKWIDLPIGRSARLWLLSSGGGAAVPRANILTNAACAAVLTRLLQYDALIEVEMMLYAASSILFLYSFVALRYQQPEILRPFRLPGGLCAICLYSAFPLLICLSVIVVNLRNARQAIAFGGVLGVGALIHVGSWLHVRCQTWRGLRRGRDTSADGMHGDCCRDRDEPSSGHEAEESAVPYVAVP